MKKFESKFKNKESLKQLKSTKGKKKKDKNNYEMMKMIIKLKSFLRRDFSIKIIINTTFTSRIFKNKKMKNYCLIVSESF